MLLKKALLSSDNLNNAFLSKTATGTQTISSSLKLGGELTLKTGGSLFSDNLNSEYLQVDPQGSHMVLYDGANDMRFSVYASNGSKRTYMETLDASNYGLIDVTGVSSLNINTNSGLPVHIGGELNLYGGFPIVFRGQSDGTVGSRNFRFDTYQDKLRIQSLDESFNYTTGVVDFLHNGNVQFFHKAIMPANTYYTAGGAIDMQNSDIIGANSIFMNDTADTAEGIAFLKTGAPSGSTTIGDYNVLRIDGAGIPWAGAERIMATNTFKFQGQDFIGRDKRMMVATTSELIVNYGPDFTQTRFHGNALVNGTLHIGGITYTNGRIIPRSTTNSSAYSAAAIEVRELNSAGAQTGAMSQAPRIAFHWGSRVAAQIGIGTTEEIRTFNNPGTGYANLRALTMYAHGGLQYAGVTKPLDASGRFVLPVGTDMWAT